MNINGNNDHRQMICMWSNSQSNYHKVKNVNYLSFHLKTSKTLGQKTFGQLDKYLDCTIGNFLIYSLMYNHYKTESLTKCLFLTKKL
jgi:hypothetical protein